MRIFREEMSYILLIKLAVTDCLKGMYQMIFFLLAPELFLIVLLGGGGEEETGEGETSPCPLSKELEICV